MTVSRGSRPEGEAVWRLTECTPRHASLDEALGCERCQAAARQSLTAITLVVPMPENIANGKMRGWRGVAARKVKYFAALDERQRAGLIPPPPKRPFEKALIRAVMYLGAAMDDGNAVHRCEKWPCDWLKTRGYIVDDRKKCLTWEGFPEQRIKRDGNYRVEITLTPVAA